MGPFSFPLFPWMRPEVRIEFSLSLLKGGERGSEFFMLHTFFSSLPEKADGWTVRWEGRDLIKGGREGKVGM